MVTESGAIRIRYIFGVAREVVCDNGLERAKPTTRAKTARRVAR